MSASPIIPPRAVFVDQNGVPLAGGSVYTYVAGTTTLKATWQDAGEGVQNANPIPLDSSGSCLLYGQGNYTLATFDSHGGAVAAFDGLASDVLTWAQVGTVTGTLTVNGGIVLTGNFTASGTISGVGGTISAGVINRGTLAGTTVNSGTISGGAMAGASITGGTIAGLGTPLLPASGGTGLSAPTAGALLVGQGTGVMTGLVPGAAGNVPVSNGTVWASANPNIGQTWLGSVTASNSASIKFTSLIGAAYDQYVLTFESLVQATPATNALFLQVSTDNGVSWKTTGYVSNLLFSTNGSYSYEASTTGVLLRDPTLLTPYHPLFGTITIANVNDASNRVVAYGNSFYDDVGNIVIAWWGGRYDTVGAINAVQLICAAGNIVSGTAKLYGMRN